MSGRIRLRIIVMLPLAMPWLCAGCGGSGSQVQPTVVGSPEQEAARVFALAQSLEKEGDTKKAFSAYHQIIRNFPATSSGTKAAARIKKAQADAMRKPQGKRKS